MDNIEQTIKEYFASKGLRPEDKVVNGTRLTYKLEDKIEDTISCIEDLELTEGVRNEFNRGKVKAYEEVLNLIK